jgi:hypothetical protein
MAHGFFPSFSSYRHDECPLGEIFEDESHVRRVKTLLSEIIECVNPQEIKQKIGGHEIKPIRPSSAEDKRVIRIVSDPNTTLLKIDYGNNPFRVYFGLSNSDRTAKIYMIDTKHRYYN